MTQAYNLNLNPLNLPKHGAQDLALDICLHGVPDGYLEGPRLPLHTYTQHPMLPLTVTGVGQHKHRWRVFFAAG